MNCVICNDSKEYLVGVVFNYRWMTDILCLKCFDWMDDIFTRAGCKIMKPYKLNNPRIIYYSTCHPSNIYEKEVRL